MCRPGEKATMWGPATGPEPCEQVLNEANALAQERFNVVTVDDVEDPKARNQCFADAEEIVHGEDPGEPDPDAYRDEG